MGSWFDDPESFEAEVRSVLLASGSTPKIAGYEALAEIGRGGQGVVYRARQTSTSRVVAIKVLLERSNTPIDRRRFEREVDLVASLRHPSIVKVHDGGRAEGERPYLVMEYVEGAPIDDALADLPISTIVRTFVDVCDAINHAHQRGVIHRDIKPSNIRMDTDGRPRVLDFGLARTAQRLDESIISVTGHFVGSLGWASPEQAAGRVNDVDVRSDVYSLGVVLYQLVTGRMPYELGQDLHQALSTIADAEPDRPSRVRGDVDSDLSTIMLRCLAKDPDRRYQTAGELGADLRRWLAGEPILARRDSALYALRKRMVRHRIVMAASCVVLLVMAAALIVVMNARNEAISQRDQAREARADEAAMTDFIEEAFTSLDPYESGARDRRVRTVLDIASADIATRFENRPRPRVGVERLLGMIYWSLGDLDRALEHLRRALNLSEAERGPDHPETLDLVNSLGAVVMDLERFDEARALFDRAEASVRRTMGVENAMYVSIRGNQAYLLHYEGLLEESDAEYREALKLARESLAPGAPGVPKALNNYSALLFELGRSDEAIDMVREALEYRVEHLGPEHPQTLLSKMNYAAYLSAEGRVQQAEPMERDVIESLTRVLGPRHDWTLNAHANLANTLELLGREEDSIELYRTFLPLMIEEQGERSDSALLALNNFAGVLTRTKAYDEAEEAYRRVIRILGERYGESDYRSVIALGNLGGVLTEKEDYDEAERILVEAADRAAEVFGADNPRTIVTRNSIAFLLIEQGKAAAALEAYESIVADASMSLGEDHWMTAVFKIGLGRTLIALERPEDALVQLVAARGVLLGSLGQESPHTQKCEHYLEVLRDEHGLEIPPP